MNKKIVIISSSIALIIGIGGVIYKVKNYKEDMDKSSENVIKQEVESVDTPTKLQNAYIDLVSNHINGDLISKEYIVTSIDGLKGREMDGYTPVVGKMNESLNAMSIEFDDKENKDRLTAAYEDDTTYLTLNYLSKDKNQKVQGIHASYDTREGGKFITEVGVRWLEDQDYILDLLDIDIKNKTYEKYLTLAKMVQKNSNVPFDKFKELIPSTERGSRSYEHIYKGDTGTIIINSSEIESGYIDEVSYIDNSGLVLKSGAEGWNVRSSIIEARATVTFTSDFNTQKSLIEKYCAM